MLSADLQKSMIKSSNIAVSGGASPRGFEVRSRQLHAARVMNHVMSIIVINSLLLIYLFVT